MPSQQQIILHEWCATKAPQKIPGQLTFNAANPLTCDLERLYPIGERQFCIQSRLARVVLLSHTPPEIPHQPMEHRYEYAGLCYETASNYLQQQRARERNEKVLRGPMRNEQGEDGNGEDGITQMEPWDQFLLANDQQNEPSEWLEPTPWDLEKARDARRYVWFGGKMIDLEEPEEPEDKSKLTLQRKKIAGVGEVRLCNHIEPLELARQTHKDVFLVLSGEPYAYAEMY